MVFHSRKPYVIETPLWQYVSFKHGAGKGMALQRPDGMRQGCSIVHATVNARPCHARSVRAPEDAWGDARMTEREHEHTPGGDGRGEG